MSLQNSKTLSICGCCKSLSRWMMCCLLWNQHHPLSWTSLPTLKSSTRVMGMNATSTRRRLYCIPMCQMIISHNKFWCSKGPYGGLWTTFSNGCILAWWPFSNKCNNFPSIIRRNLVICNHYFYDYMQLSVGCGYIFFATNYQCSHLNILWTY